MEQIRGHEIGKGQPGQHKIWRPLVRKQVRQRYWNKERCPHNDNRPTDNKLGLVILSGGFHRRRLSWGSAVCQSFKQHALPEVSGTLEPNFWLTAKHPTNPPKSADGYPQRGSHKHVVMGSWCRITGAGWVLCQTIGFERCANQPDTRAVEDELPSA